ncbi:MAG TPA: glycosyltransferase [Ohtaekwangia sp.]
MNAKPTIAFIIPGGIGTGRNNIGVPVLERIVRLLSVDFDITVFQLFPVNKDYKAEGFTIVDIYSSNLILRFAKFFTVFWKHHRQKKFQAVHGFWALPCGLLAVVAGKLYNLKSIVSVLGGDAIALPEIQYGQLQRGLNRKLIFWTLNETDEPNALTQYLVDNLEKAGYKGKPLRVIPWGIDTDLFSFKERQLKLPLKFLHIGNLHPVKDQDTLLRAFKIISDKKDAQLTLIGEGVLENHLSKMIHDLNLTYKVKIVEPVLYEQLPKYYEQADLLLHTSLSEGQSEVVTEAMSSGLLVCGTKVGLMFDLPDCCVAVDVGDFRSLAAEVLSVVDDHTRSQKIISGAVQWSVRNDIHATVRCYHDLYVK